MDRTPRQAVAVVTLLWKAGLLALYGLAAVVEFLAGWAKQALSDRLKGVPAPPSPPAEPPT